MGEWMDCGNIVGLLGSIKDHLRLEIMDWKCLCSGFILITFTVNVTGSESCGFKIFVFYWLFFWHIIVSKFFPFKKWKSLASVLALSSSQFSWKSCVHYVPPLLHCAASSCLYLSGIRKSLSHYDLLLANSSGPFFFFNSYNQLLNLLQAQYLQSLL